MGVYSIPFHQTYSSCYKYREDDTQTTLSYAPLNTEAASARANGSGNAFGHFDESRSHNGGKGFPRILLALRGKAINYE